ncbi:hypothetical protein ELE36_05555 [Pseudolysobacter antarcticus]|uniref:Uncharacterized protein n=1 Tax=Pseudolysobacter antarcticus TaxID=2511995 RepID=A0A411HHK9_9GAMM|nr:hypothetical protein [Pseudolysobacter antarcticus]QBB69877.1 hypothetical protein ELE36_05555 [Pseudolysobacter antarcticus]
MKTIFRWLSAHSQLMTGAGVGVVLGALITMPLGWHLPDQIAGLVGAFAGAIATVGGGLWLWQAQDQKIGAQTSAAVENSCGPLIAELIDLDSKLKSGQYNDDVVAWLETMDRRVATFRNRASRYEGNLFRLPGEQWRAYSELEDALDLLQDDSASFRSKLGAKTTVAQRSIVHMGWREARSMQVSIRNLGNQLRILAPGSMAGYPEHETLEADEDVMIV